MIRGTPGHASPRTLAVYLGVSPGGMTGRLDGLEKAGHVKRTGERELATLNRLLKKLTHAIETDGDQKS